MQLRNPVCPAKAANDRSRPIAETSMNTETLAIPVKTLFGIPIHAATMDLAVKVCVRAVMHRQSLVTGMVNAAKIVRMSRDPLLYNAVARSDLVLADGAAVVWAGRLLGKPLPQRVTGIDLFENLLAAANQHRFSVYFLGAAPDVLDEVVRRASARYPNLRIAGARDGYFTDDQAEQVAKDIRGAAPDILFVGITSPKKELFLDKWGDQLGVSVCHGVGGSFDVMAGKVKRAPRLWQRLGMEWLYRVVQEPGRMWKRYLVTNTLFAGMLCAEFLRTRLFAGTTKQQ